MGRCHKEGKGCRTVNRYILCLLYTSWKEHLTDQIKTEFLFGLIAEKENIKRDDDAVNSYVDYIVSASNGQFSKSSEVYKYFGSGHKDCLLYTSRCV